MTTSINPDIRLTRLYEVTNPMAAGTLELWAGARPPPGDTPTGVLQATATMPSPAGTTTYPAITFTYGTIGDALRVDSQVISWARFKDHSGVWIMDVSVGAVTAPGSPPEEILLSNTSGAVGAFLHVSAGTLQG